MLGFAPHVDAIVLVAEEASTPSRTSSVRANCCRAPADSARRRPVNKSREARYSHRSLFRCSRSTAVQVHPVSRRSFDEDWSSRQLHLPFGPGRASGG